MKYRKNCIVWHKRSVALNELAKQVQIDLGDIKEAPARYGYGTFDALTCNPPYFPSMNEEDYNLNEHLAIARHEIHCSLEDVIRVSSQLVKQGGKVVDGSSSQPAHGNISIHETISA